MKNILTILLVIIGLQAFAKSTVPSTIQKVKVFKHNAEINRSAQATINAGAQEIVVSGVSTSINPSSLQIKIKNPNCELISAKYELNHLVANTNNPRIAQLKTKAEDIADDLNWIKDQKNALLGMEEILKKNQSLSSHAGFTPSQVMELISKYKAKYLEIRKELKGILKQEKKLNQQLANTNKQLQEMSAQFNKPEGTIVLQVVNKVNTRVNISCSYTVSNAGWTPIYDLRAPGINKDVKLNYRANVYQNTGQDWNKVKLIVSTGNPIQNNNRPILTPLYASILQRYKKAQSQISSVNMGYIGNNGSASNMAYYRDEKKKTKSLADYTQGAKVSENQMAVEFNIVTKQSILSDGKQNLMALKTYDLPTDYIYHAVPKLSTGAFLLAKISDWGQYNLEAGKANLFFEGAFVGTSHINPNITSDTMLLSLGRDNAIVVERKPIEKYTKRKALAKNKKETLGYELIVRNKKSSPIRIEIMDQIPVSQNNQINVVLDKRGKATHTEAVGKLLWTTTIAAGQNWNDRFVYTVKYPKNNSIAGLK